MGFISNLAAALWMLMGSTRAFRLVHPTFPQFVLFLIIALLANVLFAWLAVPENGQFNEQGLVSYLVWPVIILVAGIILAKRSLNYSLLFVPVILWLAADTLLILLQSGIQFLENKAWLPVLVHPVLPSLFAILFIWQAVALLWIFAKRLYWPWWERSLMLLATIVLLGVWQNNISDQPIFKTPQKEILLDENAFYRQSEVFDKALLDIQKSVTGRHEWYFLGVAAYANQDVFAHEILQARQLFEERFGLLGRSISLINNPKTWGDYPIASQTSIERSLKHLGSLMDHDEDVLFMVISSHGAVDESDNPLGELVFENKPLQLSTVNPVQLRSALDQSGIRWRVIVISACYSGMFIEKLKDPYTMIITASRDDRASFGCTDDADFTYFGRAFFQESLNNSTGFSRAFSQAIGRVAEREILMGFKPSEPQIYVGEAMQIALPELEKALFEHDKDVKIRLPEQLLNHSASDSILP